MTLAFLLDAACLPGRDGKPGRIRTAAAISGNGHGDVVPDGWFSRGNATGDQALQQTTEERSNRAARHIPSDRQSHLPAFSQSR
jgi:hypothetical protein